MKPIILLSLSILLFCHASLGQFEWTRHYGGNVSGNLADVTNSADGGFLVAGSSTSYGNISGGQALLIKTDDRGLLQWQMFFGIAGSNTAHSVVQVSNGDIVVAGTHQASGMDKNIFVARFDSLGNQLWFNTYGDNLNDYAGGMVADGNNVVVTGTYNATGLANAGSDAWLFKLNATGGIIWSKEYGNSGSGESGHGIIKLHDGGFLVAGQVRYGGPNTRSYAFRTNTLGDTLWTATYEFTGTNNAYVTKEFFDCAQLLGDSVLVFTGEAQLASETGWHKLNVVRTDLNGNVLSSFVSFYISDSGADVEAHSDGGFIIAGNYANFGWRISLYKFIGAGPPVWNKQYFSISGSSYYNYSGCTSMIVAPDEGFLLAGSSSLFSERPEKRKGFLLKTDAEGNLAPQSPVIPVVAGPNSFCNGDSVVISVPDVFENYQWIQNDSSSNVVWVPNSNSASITVKEPGRYQCVMWNDNGDHVISETVNISVSHPPVSTITDNGFSGYCPPTNQLAVPGVPGTGYTWYLNGSPMAGFNQNTLNPTVSGYYTVQIANACDTAITQPIYVNAIQPVFDLSPDTVLLEYYNGASQSCEKHRFSVSSTPGSIYFWYRNGTFLSNSNSYIDANLDGYYYVVVSNNCGLTYSDTAWVVYDTIHTTLNVFGGLTTGCATQSIYFNVTYPGYNVNYYEWYKNGVLVEAGTGVLDDADDHYPALNSSGNDNGYYYCITTMMCGSLTIQHQTDSIYYAEENSSRNVQVQANGSPYTCFGSSITIFTTENNASFQWYVDTVPIPGATSQALNVTASGTYKCLITKPCGQYFSNSRNIMIGTFPSIISSDQSSICTNGTDTTVVRLETSLPFTYNTFVWRKNGVVIPGATNRYYNTKEAGVYDCIFAYPCDTLYSNTITLGYTNVNTTVYSDYDGKICPGGSVNLHAPPGYSYQWSKNNGLIPGATDSIYTTDTADTFNVLLSTGACSLRSPNLSTSFQTLPLANDIFHHIPPVSCGGTSVLLSARTRYDLTYQWYLDGAAISGATTEQYNASLPGNYTVMLTDSATCSSLSDPLYVNPSGLSNIQMNFGNYSNHCIGDTVTLLVYGNYTSYQWYYNSNIIPGATGNIIEIDSSGYYSVLVTDTSGCSGIQFTLADFIPPPAVASISTVASSCQQANGTISVQFTSMVDLIWSGPTYIPPKNSVLSVTANSLLPGVYYFYYEIAGGGCLFIDSIEVADLPGIPVQINAGTGVICQGQSINAGASYPQYLWSTGQGGYSMIPPATGWYAVTVTDPSAGCSGVDSVFVTVLPKPNVNISPAGPVAMCNNIPVTLDAGPGFSQYLWSNGYAGQSVNAITPGNYVVTVTDLNGCTNRDTTLVMPPSNLSLTNTANGPTSFCVGGSVQLSVAGSAGSLQWHRYNIPIAGATGSTHTVTVAGSYRCLVTDAFGCTAFSNPITVTTPCQPPQDPVDKLTTDNITNESISVFPNPGSGLFNIVIPESITAAEFKLFDLSGREILRQGLFQQIDHDLFLLDLLSAKAGVYYMALIDVSGNVYRHRVVKL